MSGGPRWLHSHVCLDGDGGWKTELYWNSYWKTYTWPVQLHGHRQWHSNSGLPERAFQEAWVEVKKLLSKLSQNSQHVTYTAFYWSSKSLRPIQIQGEGKYSLLNVKKSKEFVDIFNLPLCYRTLRGVVTKLWQSPFSPTVSSNHASSLKWEELGWSRT